MIYRSLFFFSVASFFFLGLTNKSPLADGKIEGTVQLVQSNANVSIPLGRYGQRQKANEESVVGQFILIWIVTEDTSLPPMESPVILDQLDLQFNPRILAVRQNHHVRILNSDPVYHNVFSLSSTKRFDVGRRPQGEYLDIEFNKPGIVDVFCDIHSNMHATIYVVSPQTFAWVSEKSGDTFSFTSVPPGNYKLKIYAPGFALSTRDITIEENQTINLGNITLSS